jgi:pimeloyl-ACP methyl ester carboxylesterase
MFHHAHARLSQVAMHYVTCGNASAEPVVLLHGWPQTWHEWRHVMPMLAARHHVIAPDLRGLGDTSRPPEGYDSATVATDVAELVIDVLGHRRFHLVGHDWGGPTAFALACAQSAAVRTLTLVDVAVPGLGPDFSQGGKRWHHAFHMTPDLPEALVQGREREYLSWFYREFAWRRDAITAADIDEYLRTYTQPGALRAGFAYYRALPLNVERNRALRDGGFRLPMPVLAVGGGRAEARGRGSEPEASVREIADDVRGLVVADSGHFVPEEQPQVLADALLAFFGAGGGTGAAGR